MLPHFTAEDLTSTLLAIVLFPVFLWVPGYAIAWLLDLFQFRRRTFPFRAVLSLPLSIALCPILTYLAGRFGGWTAVWTFYAASAVACSVILFRTGLKPQEFWRHYRPF